MTVTNHLRLVGAPDRSTSPAAALDASALLDAPAGELVVIDGYAVERHGGWRAFARAIVVITNERERDLFYCQLGGNARLPLTEHLSALDGEFVTDVWDIDDDLRIPAPDWDSDDYDTFTPDPLDDRLSPFGASSLAGLARGLAAEEHMSGMLPLLLADPASARPYASILRRQSSIADCMVREAAKDATYSWLADDLAVFAAARPHAVTLVVSDARAAEWAALMQRAACVLPTVASHC